MTDTTMDTLRGAIKDLEGIQAEMDAHHNNRTTFSDTGLRAVNCKIDFVIEGIREYVYDHGK
jgi:hypothetical protein